MRITSFLLTIHVLGDTITHHLEVGFDPPFLLSFNIITKIFKTEYYHTFRVIDDELIILYDTIDLKLSYHIIFLIKVFFVNIHIY